MATAGMLVYFLAGPVVAVVIGALILRALLADRRRP